LTVRYRQRPWIRVFRRPMLHVSCTTRREISAVPVGGGARDDGAQAVRGRRLHLPDPQVASADGRRAWGRAGPDSGERGPTRPSAVAGFDLVLAPVKSASPMWARAGAELRRAVEAATRRAQTRSGAGGPCGLHPGRPRSPLGRGFGALVRAFRSSAGCDAGHTEDYETTRR
jgi:hypothetical protein